MQSTLKTLLLCLFTTCAGHAFSQKETYDLVSYTIPPKWQKQTHANGVQLSAGDEKKGTYSSIVILRSSPTTFPVQTDFNNDWETLIKKTVAVSAAPSMLDPVENDGWKILTGTSPYTDGNSKGVAMLMTAGGYNKKISVVLVSNTDVHQRDIENFFASVDLIKPVTSKQTAASTPVAPASKSGYKFTTTNFDNGWTAIEQPEGVMLNKGPIRALLHYPDDVTEKYYPYPEDAVKACWAHLVAGRYGTVKNLKIYSQSTAVYTPAKMAEAEVIDTVSGNKLYVVLFQRDASYWTELIAPDKNTFVKEFKVDVADLEPMAPNNIFDVFSSLSDLNRFAVAPLDLTGTWTSSSASSVAYANVYTGAYAGGTVAGSNHSFTFSSGNQYSCTHNGGYGSTGNVQSYKQSFKGALMVADWSVTMTKRAEGKTEKYDAWFVAVKQGRILLLTTGTTVYTLMKAKK
jgi:hypothetical protein